MLFRRVANITHLCCISSGSCSTRLEFRQCLLEVAHASGNSSRRAQKKAWPTAFLSPETWPRARTSEVFPGWSLALHFATRAETCAKVLRCLCALAHQASALQIRFVAQSPSCVPVLHGHDSRFQTATRARAWRRSTAASSRWRMGGFPGHGVDVQSQPKKSSHLQPFRSQ